MSSKRQNDDNDCADVRPAKKSLPMTTAEDRMCEILLKKMIDRGLVVNPPAQSVNTSSSTNQSTSDAGPSTSKTTLPTVTTASTPAASYINDSVFSVNASSLFGVQGTSSSQTVQDTSSSQTVHLSNSVSLSRHLPEKIKQEIWQDKFVEFSALLPGSAPAQLSLNFSESDENPVLKITSSQKSKQLSFDQWQQAFAIFMDVVVQQNPSLASSLLVYNNLIAELARVYGVKAFNFYDIQFRLFR
ncbi:hypothetical protein LOTGIDRAFT_153150 [Lottia gigantea]|uniref:Uncharacterized protein n=1 Tax=Lottia gigantea TaxID=225164 RepID=V4AEV4_LOTGI|nr:hypothetical protein LOTGIDRAFT_153150 [Lottia gigantea]ESO93695.1 hypothetical protein LOTGIDRAFT_153150 [Lottia gigantea]